MRAFTVIFDLDPDQSARVFDGLVEVPPRVQLSQSDWISDRPRVALRVEAEHEGDAYEEAWDRITRLLEEIALDPETTLTGWTVATEGEAVVRHKQLWRLADALLREERYDLSVVTAQMACEACIRGVMEKVIAARGLDETAQTMWRMIRTYTMLDSRSREVWRVLTGQRLETARWWPQYRQHVKRRNQAIHTGAVITRDEAEASLSVSKSFINRVVEA